MPLEVYGPRFLEVPNLSRSAVSNDGEQLDEAFLHAKKRFRLAESVLEEVTARRLPFHLAAKVRRG